MAPLYSDGLVLSVNFKLDIFGNVLRLFQEYLYILNFSMRKLELIWQREPFRVCEEIRAQEVMGHLVQTMD